MGDPILEEIWRVREALIKKHGGMDGYFRYVEKLDRERRRRKQARNGTKRRRRVGR